MKKKCGGIERYMEDLPTLEEQAKSNEMISFVNIVCRVDQTGPRALRALGPLVGK